MPGCATVLPVPFVLAGLLAIAFAIPEAADGRWATAILFGLLGLAGTGAGLGLHLGFRRQAARARRLDARRAAWPAEPWRWREEWAAGPVLDSTRQQMIAAWFVAVLWNTIAIPSTWLAIGEAIRTGESVLWFAALFGLVGIGLVLHAVQETRRHRRFGSSALELETFPGFLGGTLTGRIRAYLSLHELPRIPVTLRCIQQSVEGGVPGEVVRWQARLDVVRSYRDGDSTVFRFAFRLPPDAPPSTPLPSADQVTWRLEATAERPGEHYRAAFLVPVFAPPAGALLPHDDLPIAVGPDDYTQPPSSRILVTATQRGTEIWLPPARHLVPALVVTALAVALGGLGVVLLWTEAPQAVAWLLAVIGGLIGGAAANLWFGTSQILATVRGVEITQGLLGLGRTRVIAAEEISEVTTRAGMQANARYYSDLALRLRNGRRVVLGRAIREKREAEWLADRLVRALGR